MATELIINASLPETRIALMEDGEIQELLIERASGKGIVGNIYKGKVSRVLPGMQAAFVDIGLEKAAFLYVDDVFVHSEIWEEEEGPSETYPENLETSAEGAEGALPESAASVETPTTSTSAPPTPPTPPTPEEEQAQAEQHSSEALNYDEDGESDDIDGDPADDLSDDEDDADEGDEGPVEMGPDGDEGSEGGDDRPADRPEGTTAPRDPSEAAEPARAAGGGSEAAGDSGDGSRKRHRRGRRGGRFRRRERGDRDHAPGSGAGTPVQASNIGAPGAHSNDDEYPENYRAQVQDSGELSSDRTALAESGVVAADGEMAADAAASGIGAEGRPEIAGSGAPREGRGDRRPDANRPEFRAPRGRDRKIRSRSSMRPPKPQVSIQDLLKEGQEVLVQVAKDPISTKGARLTCHISLPGRHLVCMPTIDHVGVSRRIERDDERRKLRELVERNRPKNLGFIVRTASGRGQAERRVKQDIEYLTRLWSEIREKMAAVTAPALVYEDLNSVLRAIRDWVTEDIDKVIVDSRYHFNDIQRFVSHFMPSIRQKIELYQGDIPIFDAYGISTELARALERKVWLKSGGYIVIDQAEALVAIDVNTGRYVGKKNLEDTILKTNLEAVNEIAYQLRLRNCGGIIILDLIDMERDENKQRVYRALEEAIKRDRARPTILKISELGLVEMTRKRTRDTIVRALCEPCQHCEGKGFIKSKQTIAYEVLRQIEREGVARDAGKILVQAHADVIDMLAVDERDTLDQIERRYRKQIYLQAIGDYHPEQFEVVSDRGPGVQPQRSVHGPAHAIGEKSEPHRRGGGGGRDRNRDEGRSDRGKSRNRPPGAPLVIPNPIRIAAPASSMGAEGTSADPLGAPNPSIGGESLPAAGTPTEGSAARDDGFYDEEDRLAFLRAQAAQDAALAKLRSAGAPDSPLGNRGGRDLGGPGGGRGERGGRAGRGGRGGRGRRGPGAGGPGPGKFKSGGGRGPRPFEARPAGAGPVVVPNDAAPASGDDKSGKGEGGNGGGSGPGDHSQPPT